MRKLGLVLMMCLVPVCLLGGAKKESLDELQQRMRLIDGEAYRLALQDREKTLTIRPEELQKAFGALKEFEERRMELEKGIQSNEKATVREASALLDQLEAALLSNPLLEFDQIILLTRDLGKSARHAMSGGLGIAPANFNNNAVIPHPMKNWNSHIAVLSNLRGKKKTRALYESNGVVVNDLNLHFNGDELLFSSIGTHQRWHVFSLNLKSTGLEQLTPTDITDFDCFDATYLPDGNLVFCSTATFLGLPCINGRPRMCGLYHLNTQSQKIRQLTFDQDSNWEPVVMNDGKVLYQRWEYSGLPHSNSRILFTMNPDGSSQLSFYGSNSYFPTAFFGARPIPGNTSSIVGVASGHHSVSRSGRLMVIDPTKGRHEADGVVAEIPHRGRKVEPIIRDRLPDGVWPQFMNPYPLSEKYFLVSMKEHPNALWGLYLVDTFNNMTLLYQSEGEAVIEALPLQDRPTPPIIPERIVPDSKTATVFLQDVYHGPGLDGVTKGEVKKLRIGSYFFSPYGQGGLLGTIGMDGPWDIMRVLGTVPVEEDGSALFTIPANTPVFVQPLDGEGKALQQMRSWFTAMPGERVSCIGCHENRNEVALPKMTLAARKMPAAIEEWYGPARNFSFRHEVQPVLDRYCAGCHNDTQSDLPYLKGDKMITDWDTQISGKANPAYGGHFSQAYAELHRYVRRPGIESDMHILAPMDVHADQTELIQMLKKGHHNVKLDKESLEKLYCWIDFNAPYHGQRSEIPNYNEAAASVQRMKECALKYANMKLEYDNLPEPKLVKEVVHPTPWPDLPKDDQSLANWPMKLQEAHNKQLGLGDFQRRVQLADGVSLELVKVPAGQFLMGGKNRDELPRTAVTIEDAFWIGRFEISNAQYALFDKEHDSRHEHRHGYQFGRAGYPLNHPDQPAVRVSWQDAMAFCEWLSEKTGLSFILPTEAQWEWACRGGSDADFWYGPLGTDYSVYANLGDQKLAEFAACTAYKNYESTRIISNPNKYDDWIPRDDQYNDGGFVSELIGRYRANPWELYDMHGNVWEWTLSDYKPYPYVANDGRNDQNPEMEKVVRGGSWYSRPKRATSSYRLPYRSYQKVFDVGFRVVLMDD
jgi:formylglycine-generating enzyme required for sulfatase activity